jgi:hypothetical protein
MIVMFPFRRKWCSRESYDCMAMYSRCKCSSAALCSMGQSSIVNNHCACSDENGRAGTRVNIG